MVLGRKQINSFAPGVGLEEGGHRSTVLCQFNPFKCSQLSNEVDSRGGIYRLFIQPNGIGSVFLSDLNVLVESATIGALSIQGLMGIILVSEGTRDGILAVSVPGGLVPRDDVSDQPPTSTHVHPRPPTFTSQKVDKTSGPHFFYRPPKAPKGKILHIPRHTIHGHDSRHRRLTTPSSTNASRCLDPTLNSFPRDLDTWSPSYLMLHGHGLP